MELWGGPESGDGAATSKVVQETRQWGEVENVQGSGCFCQGSGLGLHQQCCGGWRQLHQLGQAISIAEGQEVGGAGLGDGRFHAGAVDRMGVRHDPGGGV